MLVGTHIPFHIPPKIIFSQKLTACKTLIAILPPSTPTLPSPPIPPFLSAATSNPHFLPSLSLAKEQWILPTYPQPNIFTERCLVLMADGELEFIPFGDTARYLHMAAMLPHKLRVYNVEDATIWVHPLISQQIPHISGILANGFLLGGYTSRVGINNSNNNTIKSIEVINEGDSDANIPDNTWWVQLAESCIFSRNILRQTGSVATPQYIEEICHSIYQSNKTLITQEILTHDDLIKNGLNLLYSVGAGASTPPRLITLEYNNAPEDNRKIALIGKGVTFDTGGLNLKTPPGMLTMALDKGGACVVLGAFKGIVDARLKVNVTCTLALAENACGHGSYKPGDLLTGFSGITVEVGNTDAEGRLCLADAISWVKYKYAPTHIVDVATLTGAMVTALGAETGGLFTNNPEFAREICTSAHYVMEKIWEMPIFDDHIKCMKGTLTDLCNTTKGKGKYPGAGGACTAAAFLKRFVEEDGFVDWVHIDASGPIAGQEDKGVIKKGGNAYATQLLMQYAKTIHMGNI